MRSMEKLTDRVQDRWKDRRKNDHCENMEN